MQNEIGIPPPPLVPVCKLPGRACLLLALLAGGCSGYEPVQLNQATTIPTDRGKCQQLIGTRAYDVECQKK